MITFKSLKLKCISQAVTTACLFVTFQYIKKVPVLVFAFMEYSTVLIL